MQGYIKKKSEFEKMETGSFEKIFIFAQYDKGFWDKVDISIRRNVLQNQ